MPNSQSKTQNRKPKWWEKQYKRTGYAQIAGKSQYGEAYSPLGTLDVGHGSHGISEIQKKSHVR